jgi:alginate biosynthesis protein AlgX
MKKTLKYVLATTLALCSLPGIAGTADTAKDDCDELECLICPAVTDPDQYQGRGMKLMSFIAPGDNRWLFRSSVDLINEFGIPTDMQPEFARLMAAFAAKGTHVVMAVQPTRGLMHHDKVRPDRAYGFDYAKASASLQRMQQQLKAGGAIVPDMLQVVKNPPKNDYFFRRDSHWTPAGAEATARVVADEIMRQPFYKDLTNKRYRTEPGVTIPKNGILDMALDQICHNTYGYQFVKNYRTVPDSEDASGLFEDAPDPEVVLVGTSNSAAREDETRQYNFDGYLKQFLSVDVLNFALPGAGQDGALLEYLLSDNYSPDNAPKLVIWELPANYSLESPYLHRQLIPAINGGCSKAETMTSHTLKRSALKVNERIEILSNAGARRQDLRNSRAFIDLNISDKSIKDFYLITYYDNGARDKVMMRRQAVVTGGQYYLELSRSAEFRDANLLSVFLEPTQDAAEPFQVETKLCL